MNLKTCGRTCSWPDWRYYPETCLEGLRKATKTLGWPVLGRDLNLGLSEFEAVVSITRLRCSLLNINDFFNFLTFYMMTYNSLWVIIKSKAECASVTAAVLCVVPYVAYALLSCSKLTLYIASSFHFSGLFGGCLLCQYYVVVGAGDPPYPTQ